MTCLFTPPSFEMLSARYGERYRWLLLIVVGMGTVAGVLSTSSFNVAVAILSREFGLGQERIQWAMTGFMAAMTIAMLPASWLLDRFGFRQIFLLSLMLLIITSVAGYFSPNFGFVVGVRVLQGAATGILQPLGMLIVMRHFPAKTRGTALGIMTFGIAFTPAVAPALGGILVDQFGWRAIFLLNFPFCVLALISGFFFIPTPKERKKHPFDRLGTFLLAVATGTMIEGVASLKHSGLMSWSTWGHFVLSISLTVIFIFHARRTRFPIISLGLFRQRTFSMGTIVSFTYGFGLFGSTYLIPVFLQNALGYSATAAGTALLPSGIALVATTPIAGYLADRYAPKNITISGLFLFGMSFFIFSAVGGNITYGLLISATIIGRIGLGLILPSLSLATMHHLEPHHFAQSSIMVSYMRQLGGVIGIAMIAVFVEWRASLYSLHSPQLFIAYTQAFFLLGSVMLASIVAAGWMRGGTKQHAT